jgi:hypothetical protein
MAKKPVRVVKVKAGKRDEVNIEISHGNFNTVGGFAEGAILSMPSKIALQLYYTLEKCLLEELEMEL